MPVLKKKSTGLTQISNKNCNFANKNEKGSMKKANYERLRDAYQQYIDAETAYMKACGCDDDTDRWEKEHYLNVYTDLLTIAVKEILEDEEEFMQ